MPKTLEGYIGDEYGAPLDGVAAVVTRLDGTTADTGVSGPDGRWVFSGLDEADEHFVTLRDGAGRAAVRGPWSGELREAWVRDRLSVAGKPLVIDPAAGNLLAWSAAGLYAAGLDLATADGRYVNSAGTDTKTGRLNLYEATPSDVALVVGTAAIPTPYFSIDASGNLSWGEGAGFDTIMGRSAVGTLMIGSSPLKVSPDAGNAFEWRATGWYAPTGLSLATLDARYEPLDSMYTKAESDARYPLKTDLDPYPSYLTQTEGDARYPLKTDPDPYPTYMTQAESDARYLTPATALATYVELAGDTMTGDLAIEANTWTIGKARAYGTGNYGRWEASAARGTKASPLPLEAWDTIGQFAFERYANGAFRRSIELRGLAQGASATTNYAGILSIQVADSTGTLNDRVWLYPTGDLHLGPNSAATPSAGPHLTINNVSTLHESIALTQFVGDFNGPYVTGYKGRGTRGSPSDVLQYDNLYGIWASGWAAGAWRSAGGFNFAVSAAPGASWVPGYFSLWLTDGAGASKERLRFDHNGRFWMNPLNTSPSGYTASEGLSVQTSEDSALRGILSLYQAYAAATGNRVLGYKSRGTVGSPTVIIGGDELISIEAFGHDGSAYRRAVKIALMGGAPAASTVSGRISIYMTDSVTNTPDVERLRVTTAGLFGFGASAAGGPSATIDVKPEASTTPAMIARAHASAANTLAWFQAVNNAGLIALGANNLGPVTEKNINASAVTTVVRALAWYNAAGTFLGYMPLYQTVT